MNHKEQTALSPSSKTGLAATLCTRLRPKGTGASKITSLALLLALTTLTLTATPALATTPETPETGAGEPTATTAVLHGTLNPNAPGTPGSYQFSYLPSATECVPGTLAPAFPTFATGAEKEAVETTVTGLEPSREYAFCLIAYSILGAAEPSEPSPPVPFTTAAAAPSVDAESASAVTSTTATLEAQVNPNNQSTTYAFEYSTEQSGGVLGGTIVTVPAVPGGPLEGFGDQTASAPTEPLLPDTTYFYRVVATNATGTQDGAVSETGFTTLATPTTEAATGVTSTTATFHGTLTPLTETPGAEAQYSFAYAQGSEDCTAGTATGATGAGTGKGPQAVEAEATGLQPGATYSVCLVSSNAFGSEVDPSTPQQHFTTLPGPPSIEAQSSSAITPEGATLETTVNPNNQETTCSFEYSTDSSLATGVTTVPCSQPLGAGGAPATGSATVTGLELHREYFFRAVAKNASGTTTDPTIEHFETETTVAPSLESEAATAITPTTATLTAKVNPNGAQIKTCTFEYGTDTSYGHPVPCTHPDAAEVGAGREPVPVSAHLTELKVNTTYHWRLSATSAAGTATSVDHTFVEDTEPATVPGSCGNQEAIRAAARSTHLPDCRAYEMVTPPQKDGALINSLFAEGSNWGPLIAGNGTDIMAPSIQCFANTESCTGKRQVEGEPYEFARTGQGWVTHPLAPPAPQFGTTSQWGANADTHTTLFSAAPSPESPDDFYLRRDQDTPVEIGPVSESFNGIFALDDGLIPIEATRDLSHMLFIGKGLWSLDGHQEAGRSVYEYAGAGKSKPLSVGVSGPLESTSLISECETRIGGDFLHTADRYGSFSEDGHIVYFTAVAHGEPGCAPTANAPLVNELYARVDGETSDAHTVLVSGPTPDACKSATCQENTSVVNQAADARKAEFEGATRDGSRVLFTSTQQLSDQATEGASTENVAGEKCQTAVGSGCNLYESVCAEPCGSHGEEPAAKERELIDVSDPEGTEPVPGGPRVQGVMAISSDGSHVYFVARGKLAANVGVLGAGAEEGKNNLYAYATGQPLRFIATLPQADESIFKAVRASEWTAGIELADVTPNGRFLVFESHAALTADDTRPDVEGGPTPPTQIYRYDAQTDAIVRISIGQHGFNDDGNAGSVQAESAIVPAFHGWNYPIGPGRADLTMSDDGQDVFFESPVALTPGALNEVNVGAGFPGGPALAENVYEYHDGNVSLISDGKDVTPNSAAAGIETSTRLVGTDPSGKNVFFATNDQVTPQDTDTQRDYYDARVCEEADPCVAPPPSPAAGCSEEACRGQAPGAPSSSTPGSESFTGPGNLAAPPPPAAVKPKPLTKAQKLAKALKACRTKHNHAKRAKCEKAARKAFGSAAKAHKATTKRRSR